jgi:hypothetical protein
MKTITLRHLPPPLSRLLQRRAMRERSSLNKTAIRVMEESLGLATLPKKKRQHDLDRFAGLWSAKEARDFDRLLKAQRKIDPGMWK